MEQFAIHRAQNTLLVNCEFLSKMTKEVSMLISEKEIDIRFSEVDMMGIVWHGNHIKYFEDGREHFGKKYEIGYMEVHRRGFVIPVVDIQCSYKRSIPYETTVIVETKYINSPAAKIIFEYRLIDKHTRDVYATGKSVQVFLTKDGDLHLTVPDFYADWKKKWGITN